MKKAFIIGAGPAGLTAAYELLKQSDEYEVTVFEESFHMGGISKTVNYKGNRMDMGGHRFFSKVPEVNAWWEQMLPMQGAPAADDIMLQRDVPLEKGGPDPQKEDRVMLNRNRVSRIYFDQKFYDYPIQLKPELFMNMGFLQTMQVGFSYLASLIHKRPENSLEDFYINRFGKKLYSMFFEHYTENLWGRHPRDIDPSWGAQRVKGLSIIAILKDILWKIVPTKKAHQVETSLIESFRYPKLGPGELWDVTASEIEKLGGKILKGCKVVGLEKDANDHIVALTYEQDGKKIREEADVFISSMPIRDLVGGMNDVPEKEAKIAAGLPYRDYRTLGFFDFAVDEIIKMGMIDSKDDVLDTHSESVKKAYPAYFDTYEEIDTLIHWLNGIDNLYCVGRNGQHRYNNIDHSMCTSFEVVHNIVNGIRDRSNIWNVNTEKEYHEAKN